MPHSESRNLAADKGSAPVEFLAFGVPLVLVVLVSTQLLIASYLANVALDAANEGAQALAYSDGSELLSKDRVAKVIGWLAPQSAIDVESVRRPESNVSVAVTTVRLTNPFLIWAGQPIQESGSVIDETN